MSRKKMTAAEDVLKMYKSILACVGAPSEEMLPEFFEKIEIELGNFELSLSDIYVAHTSPTTASPRIDKCLAPVSGTKPITIRVHNRVIRAFKAQAATTGTRYQKLIHRALSEAADRFAL